MKTFDWTKLGGFPLTQNALAYMQEAYTEIAKALIDTSSPVVLSGLKASTSGTTTSYTEGFVAYQGEVIKVPAGSHHVSAVASAQIKIVTLTTTLVYDNGSSHASKLNKVGQIVQDASGTFLIKDLITLEQYRAAGLRDPWVIAKNDLDGYVRYQVDRLNKRCTVQGWSRHYNVYSSPSGLPYGIAIQTGLPVPDCVDRINFDTVIHFHQQPIVKTSANSEEYRGEKGGLSTSGILSIASRALAGSWSEASLRALKHYFNFTYPIL